MRCVLLSSRLGWMTRSCLFYRSNPIRRTQAAYATRFKRHQVVTISHYDTLEVSHDASPKEIKDAFITLSKRYHPDVNTGDPTATARITAINEAYSCLSDENLREIYNQVTFESVFEEDDYYVPERYENERDEDYNLRFKQEHAVAWYLHTLRERTPNVAHARRMFIKDMKILVAIMIALHVLVLVSFNDDDKKLQQKSYKNSYDDFLMGYSADKKNSQFINDYFEDKYKEE
ncbi:dnaJ homolog subfamily C member 18-like [Mizuhopecten yessoensis]|uniref:Chaperone protein DnaJ n=1 Tax=Mizuhopecten yessoensis TaxID=6573 RepID=A0A210QGL4_MIZYE|nr:dnaJ homolog subfamily C member 18-like [Mizuhopecten yessoensis]OWF47895.1 Chaperone protein DnaJ [Mizuhopecten yessoensis]